MVCFDGNNTIIYNGGSISSKLRYRNKKYSQFQRKLSRCKKYSKRYRKLNRAKDRILGDIKNQIKDVLEKYSSHLISYCFENKISTIVVGDIKGIRESVNFNKVSNQKIHQWTFNKLLKIIERKSKYIDIKVEFQEESYTSQSCPMCGEYVKIK